MCGPLAVAAVVTTAAGIGQAVQQVQAGKETASQYRYFAGLTETQQAIARVTAERRKQAATEGASRESAELSRNYSEFYGAQEAAIAANKMAGSVTAADIIKDTFNKQKLDEMTLRYNADVKRYEIEEGLGTELWGLENKRRQYLAAGKNARRAGNIQAFNTLLATAGMVATMGALGAGPKTAETGISGYGKVLIR